MTRPILIFGHTGQVAQALQAFPNTRALGRDRVDLMQPGQARAAILCHGPSAVINAAAFTDVEGAEGAGSAAYQLNAAAVGEIAEACAALAIPFVHLSTDYVFDGAGDVPWAPADTARPMNAYGHSKWAGECVVRDAGGVYVILRTSWVFSPKGKNFVTIMQSLAQTRSKVAVIGDQIGGPTPATAIAAACINIATQLGRDPSKTGTYHFAGAPYVSWADFARTIFADMGSPCQVQDIPSAVYPTTALRPLNSRLDCTSLTTTFGISAPQWRRYLWEGADGKPAEHARGTAA